MKAATLARLAILIGAVFLAGCNAPHSEEANKDNDAADPPLPVVVTHALAASKDAEKLEGVATVLNPDPLLQLDADIGRIEGMLDRDRRSVGEAQAAVSCLGLCFWHGEQRTVGVDLGDHR